MYTIEHGRVRTFALEVHAADHCNLTCAGCCTQSPQHAPRFADPDAVYDDLVRLAPTVHPEVVKLTGGEPTLHPDLVGLAQAARRSGIAGQISVTTNGFLLMRQPDALLEAIDQLTLSWYASRPLPDGMVARIEARCAAFGVRLRVKPTSAFQQIDADEPDDGQAAWSSCWMRTRCHTVHRGRFYLCGRAPHVTPDDGVPLDQPDTRARLLDLLRRDAPMAACATCLGNRGPIFAHRQLSAT